MPLPENTIKITQLNAGTVKAGSLFATSEPDTSTPPVYSSMKISAAEIAVFVATVVAYSGLTETTAQTLVGAINELALALVDKQDDLEGGLLASVDLNDLITNKNYWVSRTSIINAPVDAFGYLEVIRAHTTDTGYILMQRFTRFGANNLAERAETYVRFYSNSQWYGWNKVAQVIT